MVNEPKTRIIPMLKDLDNTYRLPVRKVTDLLTKAIEKGYITKETFNDAELIDLVTIAYTTQQIEQLVRRLEYHPDRLVQDLNDWVDIEIFLREFKEEFDQELSKKPAQKLTEMLKKCNLT